jgi:hypothetical protein
MNDALIGGNLFGLTAESLPTALLFISKPHLYSEISGSACSLKLTFLKKTDF